MKVFYEGFGDEKIELVDITDGEDTNVHYEVGNILVEIDGVTRRFEISSIIVETHDNGADMQRCQAIKDLEKITKGMRHWHDKHIKEYNRKDLLKKEY